MIERIQTIFKPLKAMIRKSAKRTIAKMMQRSSSSHDWKKEMQKSKDIKEFQNI